MMKTLVMFTIILLIVYGIVAVPTMFYNEARVGVLLLFILLASSSVIAVVLMTTGENLKNMRMDEYVVTGALAAIFSTGVFWGMMLPGVLYEIPLLSPFIIMLANYLPKAVIYGIAIGYTCKPFTSTLFFLIWGIASEIMFPNPVWAPYYVAWGAILDLFLMSSKGDLIKRDLILLGFIFGYAGWGLTKAYEIVLWGNWHPLRLVMLAMVMNGGVTSLGVSLGYKLGRKAKVLIP